MGYPEPEQRPVNFNDTDSTGPPAYDGLSRNEHKTPVPSTMYSMPGISRPVSGITAEELAHRDEYGQTRAESVARQYRRSTAPGAGTEDSMYDVDFDGRSEPSPIHPRSPGDQKPLQSPYDSHKSSIYPYGASTDAITYVDENFNTYSSRRRKPEAEPARSPDTPGVQQHFQDLGESTVTYMANVWGTYRVSALQSMPNLTNLRGQQMKEQQKRERSRGSSPEMTLNTPSSNKLKQNGGVP